MGDIDHIPINSVFFNSQRRIVYFSLLTTASDHLSTQALPELVAELRRLREWYADAWAPPNALILVDETHPRASFFFGGWGQSGVGDVFSGLTNKSWSIMGT